MGSKYNDGANKEINRILCDYQSPILIYYTFYMYISVYSTNTCHFCFVSQSKFIINDGKLFYSIFIRF